MFSAPRDWTNSYLVCPTFDRGERGVCVFSATAFMLPKVNSLKLLQLMYRQDFTLDVAKPKKSHRDQNPSNELYSQLSLYRYKMVLRLGGSLDELENSLFFFITHLLKNPYDLGNQHKLTMLLKDLFGLESSVRHKILSFLGGFLYHDSLAIILKKTLIQLSQEGVCQLVLDFLISIRRQYKGFYLSVLKEILKLEPVLFEKKVRDHATLAVWLFVCEAGKQPTKAWSELVGWLSPHDHEQWSSYLKPEELGNAPSVEYYQKVALGLPLVLVCAFVTLEEHGLLESSFPKKLNSDNAPQKAIHQWVQRFLSGSTAQLDTDYSLDCFFKLLLHPSQSVNLDRLATLRDRLAVCLFLTKDIPSLHSEKLSNVRMVQIQLLALLLVQWVKALKDFGFSTLVNSQDSQILEEMASCPPIKYLMLIVFSYLVKEEKIYLKKQMRCYKKFCDDSALRSILERGYDFDRLKGSGLSENLDRRKKLSQSSFLFKLSLNLMFFYEKYTIEDDEFFSNTVLDKIYENF